MEDKLKRLPNEDLKQYKIRLFRNKIEYGINPQEIANLINKENEQNYNESTYRKWFASYDEGYQDGVKNNITDDEILNELELKRIEIEKEKIKLRTTKVEYNKYLRQDARLEMFFDEMKKSITVVDVPEFTPIMIDKSKKEKIGLLGIADFHFGKIFNSINNKYSEEIFYERMNKLISETIELCKEQNISHLHVLNLGDDIEGMTLRISQLASLQDGMTDQTIKVARFIVKFLTELSKYITITYHHTMCGNHSEIRAFNDKSFTYENMERIIISYVRDVLKDNSRIEIPEYGGKFVDFKIFNYNIFAQHGQKVKNPKNIIAEASQLHRKWFDVAYFGHLHHEMAMTTNEAPDNDCEVIYVPSIMGSDEYSDDNYFGGAKSSAKLDIYEDGQCRRASFKIKLN